MGHFFFLLVSYSLDSYLVFKTYCSFIFLKGIKCNEISSLMAIFLRKLVYGPKCQSCNNSAH